jgi:DNA-binding response OmpR family regulator
METQSQSGGRAENSTFLRGLSAMFRLPWGSRAGGRSSKTKRKLVLIVESEHLSRLILQDKLWRCGFDVEVAVDGLLGLQNRRGRLPDAVVTEALANDIPGLDFRYSKFPVYVFTCHVQAYSNFAGFEPIKIVSRLSVPVDKLVSEIAADLHGAGSDDASPDPTRADAAQPNALSEIPVLLKQSTTEACEVLKTIATASEASDRVAAWQGFRSKIRSLLYTASIAGMHDLASHCAALDAYMCQGAEDPGFFGDTIPRPISEAAEVLEHLTVCLDDVRGKRLSEFTADIVAEEADHQASVSEALAQAGIITTSLGTPAQALDHLGTRQSDLLVLDLLNPDADGLCVKLCQIPVNERTPVILLSAGEVPESTRQACPNLMEVIVRPCPSGELVIKALNVVRKWRKTEPAESSGEAPALSEQEIDQTGEAEPSRSQGPDVETESAHALPFSDGDAPVQGSQEVADACVEVTDVKKESEVDRESSVEREMDNNMRVEGTTIERPARATAESVVVLVDETGQILDAHPSCEDMMEWTREDLVGQSIEDLFEAGGDAVKASLRTNPDEEDDSVGKPMQQVDAVIRKREGAQFPASVTIKKSAYQNCWLVIFRCVQPDSFIQEFETESKGAATLETSADDLARDCGTEDLEDQEVVPGGRIPQSQDPAAAGRSEADDQEEQPANGAGDRKALVERILANETELHMIRRQLERQSRRCEELEAQLGDLRVNNEKLQTSLEEKERQEKEIRLDAAEKGTPTGETPHPEPAKLEAQETIVSEQPAEWDRRLRASIASLGAVTAQLEAERGQRSRSEQRAATLAAQLQALHESLKIQIAAEVAALQRVTELEESVLNKQEVIERVEGDLHRESTERQLAEEQLRAAEDLCARYESNVGTFEEARESFKRTQEEMEFRLKTSLNAWMETESKLRHEATERLRLAAELETAQRTLKEQTEMNSLELCRLQSAAEIERIERERSGADELRARYAAISSGRTNRVHLNRMRDHVAGQVEEVRQAACALLREEMSEPQKKLLETLLENTLVVQASLRDAGIFSGSSGAAESELHADGELFSESETLEVAQLSHS